MTKKKAIYEIRRAHAPVHISTYEIGGNIRNICVVYTACDKYFNSIDELPRTMQYYMQFADCTTTDYYHNNEYQFTCSVYHMNYYTTTTERTTKRVDY